MDVTFSIDRTSLSLAPLVFSGVTDGNAWGILPGYQLPDPEPIIAYAWSSFHHGATTTGWKLPQAFLQWEADLRTTDLATAVAEARAALWRDSFIVTTTEGTDEQDWRCDPGSIVRAPADLLLVRLGRPTFSITIPCYPLAVS